MGRRGFWRWAALLTAAIVSTAPGARADDDVDVPVLPPVEIQAPRVGGGPGASAPARAQTPLRRDVPAFDVPSAVSVLEQAELSQRRLVRSLPDALQRLPGVLVQKTAPLQVSPFIRGFTAYHNVLLVDGVRLNHSAFRAGPNQYWSTVDAWTVERLEVVRGPHSVLYGSDAVGGTVNAVTKRRTRFPRGLHLDGRFQARTATAETMFGGRAEVEGNLSGLGWLGGLTYRSYGTIRSGGEPLPGTGGIDEIDGDLRFDHKLNPWWTLTLAGQHVDQDDAPRTERTVDSVPFAGTLAGSELRRDLDQQRTLVYGRLAYDARGTRGPVERGSLTLSWQRHDEVRNRLRTGDRRDRQGFTLDQIGVAAQLASRTHIGHLTYGAEWTHDEIDSFRDTFTGGVPGGPTIQGPVGDDARYDLLGVYVQDHLHWRRWDLFAGVRFTYARAEAGRVDNPAVAGADPATPGNVIAIRQDWTSLVGSLRATYALDRHWRAFGGVSQAFRAPSLHDLTSLESTSVVETPSPGLAPEDYVAFELGLKTQQPRISAEAAVWYTAIDDAIIRSPTGALLAGVPVVRKDNIGDGHAWGFEFGGAWRLVRGWTLFGNVSWMDSSAKELDAGGLLVDSPLSREKPLTGLLGLRVEPAGTRLWAQGEWAASARADDLSLRDRADTRRIPPGGTPSWSVLNLRAGLRVGKHSALSIALENVFDKNYRLHGSGQNEPGRNLVVGLVVDW